MEQQDGACATQCHSGGAAEFHVNLVAEEAKNFAFSIDDVGVSPANDEITNQVHGLQPDRRHDIRHHRGGPFDDSSARLRFRVAWSSDDYSNHESGEVVGQPLTSIDARVGCNAAMPPEGSPAPGPSWSMAPSQ